MTGHLHAIIVQFPRRVPCKVLEYICVQIPWLIWMNINFNRTDNILFGKDSCETRSTAVINDRAKIFDNKGQVDTVIVKTFSIHLS